MKFNFDFVNKIPASQRRITLPTKLTILRITSVPFMIFFMINHNFVLSFWLIVLCAITDLFDGILARYLNQQTILGACLDPLADKLFILSCYFVFTFSHLPIITLPFWFTMFIFLKELLLVLGAISLYLIRSSIDVKPNWLGKLCMDIQTFFILWVFTCYFLKWNFVFANQFIMYAIVALVLSSFIQYVRLNIGQIRHPKSTCS